MKKTLFILFFVLTAFIRNVNAQTTGVPDTLAYLQTIVANKTFYIGKPFSVLMDSLKIQIKHFSPFPSLRHDKTKEKSTSFGFYFPENEDEIYLTYPRLDVYWQPYLNANQSDILWENNNGGGWTQSVRTYYSSAIVKDISILE